jgi:hypothetical protein
MAFSENKECSISLFTDGSAAVTGAAGLGNDLPVISGFISDS